MGWRKMVPYPGSQLACPSFTHLHSSAPCQPGSANGFTKAASSQFQQIRAAVARFPPPPQHQFSGGPGSFIASESLTALSQASDKSCRHPQDFFQVRVTQVWNSISYNTGGFQLT